MSERSAVSYWQNAFPDGFEDQMELAVPVRIDEAMADAPLLMIASNLERACVDRRPVTIGAVFDGQDNLFISVARQKADGFGGIEFLDTSIYVPKRFGSLVVADCAQVQNVVVHGREGLSKLPTDDEWLMQERPEVNAANLSWFAQRIVLAKFTGTKIDVEDLKQEVLEVAA